MTLVTINDKNTNFDLVFLHNGTPHCQRHMAMNKVSVFKGGGYWRCLQGQCRAGCIELNN